VFLFTQQRDQNGTGVTLVQTLLRHTDDTPAHTETEHSMDCVKNRKIHEGAVTEN